MAVGVVRRRFKVAEYYLMAEAGIFHEDSRVELIEGDIVEMTAISSRHAACVSALNSLLSSQIRGRAILRPQSPVHLDRYSEPEPDLALVKPREDLYRSGHPGPDDVLLLVEVSDTSLDFDRDRKIPLYARLGICEVWIVNLKEDVVEVYRRPTAEGSRAIGELARGKTLSVDAFPDITVPVGDLLG